MNRLAIVLGAALALFGGAVQAQTITTPPVAPSDLPAVIAANLPWANTIAPVEAVAPTVGTANTIPRADRPPVALRRAASFTVTGAAGAISGTWSTPSSSSSPNIIFTPIYSGSGSISCQLTAAPTATAFAGKCFLNSTVNLTLSALTNAALVGINLGPTPAPAGTVVQVTALPPTQ